ncbi:DUF2590 family protein [Marinomonas aquiplantarum]|uniref:Uncharacterized protein DUF2590 n=1 Tax=Marinomonas aquiplantarum TaxID=491951 RepID=A0A366D9G2_9GAMM|nr:DUF2590 family protein [Marinomonas aquiplantarum]RBO85908.1 uncharacterized protein DUF2590 [Marinomonas aquiplantarum]
MASIDLLIQNDDLVLSGLGEPELVSLSDCVAQDLRHMMREKGYAILMVGERNRVSLTAAAKVIELEIENDSRIYPGTASVELNDDVLTCVAQTIDGEYIEVSL